MGLRSKRIQCTNKEKEANLLAHQGATRCEPVQKRPEEIMATNEREEKGYNGRFQPERYVSMYKSFMLP
eukprot:c39616_g1_i1 orf=85-291(-)